MSHFHYTYIKVYTCICSTSYKGFAQSAECAMQSRNFQNVQQSTKCHTFYRLRRSTECAEYTRTRTVQVYTVLHNITPAMRSQRKQTVSCSEPKSYTTPTHIVHTSLHVHRRTCTCTCCLVSPCVGGSKAYKVRASRTVYTTRRWHSAVLALYIVYVPSWHDLCDTTCTCIFFLTCPLYV